MRKMKLDKRKEYIKIKKKEIRQHTRANIFLLIYNYINIIISVN